MPKNLIYIANARIPTEKAHGVQIMKMCEAFADSRYKIELVVPKRKNILKEFSGIKDWSKRPGVIFGLYGIRKEFPIKFEKCFDMLPYEKFLGKLAFYIQVFSFARNAKKYAVLSNADFIYCRDNILLPFLLKTGKKVIYEAHVFPEKVSHGQIGIWKKCHKIITITNGLKKLFVEKGIEEEKVLAAPDGVDLDFLGLNDESEYLKKEYCREELSKIPKDKKRILYTGHLFEWKGANVLLDAAKCLEDYYFVFIGGTEGDVKRFKNKAAGLNNVFILGHVPHLRALIEQKSADVLVLPNTAKEKISSIYTSPLKLFEYMASGVPIVASDLPSIREILSEETAWFFEADNAGSLAEKIKEALEKKEISKKKAEMALEEVKKYTWNKRAENILNFVK